MRHGASLIVDMEAMSRPAFHIAKELAQNSRSGLTVRFLSKKLELPQEEIEYLIDMHDRLFFTDLTKVKLVAEGASAIARISLGLENHGDVPSLFRRIKALDSHEFRRFEERLGLERVGGKTAAAEELVARYYRHPESVVEYVATRGFSRIAQELFDLVWQSEAGVLPVSQLRSIHGGPEYEVEQGLWELSRGFALFEMFRFDSEERLVRVAGLLSELRQWRESHAGRDRKVQLKPCRKSPGSEAVRGMDFSERVCRLVAALAAKPVRIRGDGDLFREDRRRLGEVCSEDDEPSLATCLWVAQGVGWVARVDNELRAGNTGEIAALDRLGRHRLLTEWLLAEGNEAATRRTMGALLDDLKTDAWYPVIDFIYYARQRNEESELPVLKQSGGHWQYVSPGLLPGSDRGLARSLDETLLWLGIVDRAEHDGESLFRVTALGRHLLVPETAPPEVPDWKLELVVQPNFDIVVASQQVDPMFTVPLDQFAERASTGHAIVYRLTKESFTRAVQSGHGADSFLSYLLRFNRGGKLPPNVLTTLDSWRGGMKRVRLRTVQVLESDDPLVIADLMHRKRFAKHLAPLDPSRAVALDKIRRSDLTKELEKEGFVIE